jgi:predicted TIM-barrel fold metal-dependent hydrolase
MKIYDPHVHLFMEGGIPDAYEIGMARTMKLVLKNKFKLDMTLEDARTNLIKGMYDENGSKALEAMGKAGIEKSFIFGSDFGAEIGSTKIHPFEGNMKYAEIAKKSGGRFIAVAALDPRRPGALKHLEKCVEEMGIKGLKLHPAAGFYPTDEILYPFYEKCADWNIPIIFHTGAQPAAPVYLDTQRPLFIAEAATRFPDTKMIMAHVGMDLWNEAVMYGKLIPNVYFDISYHQFSFVSWGPQKFYEWLRFLIDECGASKLMWATDSPLPCAILPTDAWVKVFTERNTTVQFTDEEMEMIMGGTTAEVFNIDVKGAK